MFDVAPTELLLVALVALVVIGPKDLPRVMRTVGHWVNQMRGMARQFRSGFDEMVRQADIEDLERKWAEENARIMREHPMIEAPAEPQSEPDAAGPAAPPEPLEPDTPPPVTEAPPLAADGAPAPQGAAREGELPFPDKPA
jgi:sec-independent protein translocase protein TatB